MDWVHLHLVLNHVPVLGTVFVCFLLAWSWGRRNQETLKLSLWLCVLLSLASVGIKFTGDFAAEGMQKLLGPDMTILERHEESADQATTAVFLVGLCAGLNLFLSRRGRMAPRWSLALLVMTVLVTFTLMARTANLGGHIRHPETRS